MERWSPGNLSIKDVENLGTVLRFLCQRSGCSLSANSAMFSNTQSLNLIQKPVTYVQRWRGVKKGELRRLSLLGKIIVLKSLTRLERVFLVAIVFVKRGKIPKKDIS